MASPSQASRQPFTLDELDRIAAHLPADLRALPRFAVATGMRVGELLALQWGDVVADGEFGRVRVSRTVDQFGDPRYPRAGGVRMIPLGALALDALAGHSRQGELVFGRREADGTEKPLKSRVLGYLWTRACEEANVEYRSFYQLRRTFARENLAQGVPIGILSAWMGTDVRIAESLFAHSDLTRWRPWPQYGQPLAAGVVTGYVFRQKTGWAVRWRQPNPAFAEKLVRRQRGGFRTRHDAESWLRAEIAKTRRWS